MNPSTTPIRSNVANVLLQMRGNEPIEPDPDLNPLTRPTSSSSSSSGISSTTQKSSLHIPIIPSGTTSTPIVDVSGCNCKKSKCLKLYCACFAARIYCCPTCNCVSCANTVNNINERQDAVKQILDRNPAAFESKFKSVAHPWKDPIAAHKTGCRCRKSQCLKKYCECFQAGVICNSSCTCLQCANDGSGRPAAVIPKAKATELEKEKEKKELILPLPVHPYAHDHEVSIRIAAEVLMRARDDDSYQEPVNVIPKEESLESVDSLFERSISLLQKRKRDDQGDPGETTEQASESIAPTSSERIHLTELSTPKRPSILGRVCPPSRSALKVSGGFSTLVNNQCYRMTSRFASPNTLICASALSMLSRKDTSPKALSTAATSVDCRLSPSMTDRLLPTSSTLTKTPGTPCGINFVPQTPDFKPFSRLEHSKAQENESPYSCKSAVHLLPDSFESYPTDSSGIPQISLPLYLLSNEDDNWTKPVIDVKSLISKNADTHPLHSL